MQRSSPGAIVGGVLSMAFVSPVVHTTRIKTDTAMGISVAVFFGGGIALFSIVALLVVLIGWKEFKLHTFDPGFAASIGYPMHRIDQALLAVIVLAIVVGLRTVGVILMVSLLVAPRRGVLAQTVQRAVNRRRFSNRRPLERTNGAEP